MEPRARASKNVGKMNFTNGEISNLLYAHGDVRQPLPETVRVLDEILTDFIQGVAFEATRAASYTGRQKLKFEDFEFAFRKNPEFLGKVQETFAKKREIDESKKSFRVDDIEIAKDAADTAALAGTAGAAAGSATAASSARKTGATAAAAGDARAVRDEEELGEADDDMDAEHDALGRRK